MNNYNTSLILIGMPSAGKSTIGKLLAESLKKEFIDSDKLIEQQQQETLQHIVDNQGYLALRNIEEKTLLATELPNHIIATGGSAVYSMEAMQHLKHFGLIIFLDVDLIELQARMDDFATRGIARAPKQSFTELFAERRPLYQKYADITIECRGKSPQEILTAIIGEESEAYTEMDA